MNVPSLLTNEPATRRRTGAGSVRKTRSGCGIMGAYGVTMMTMRRGAGGGAVGSPCRPAGCATARNYPAPGGPRFGGQFAGAPTARVIRVVSFNIKYGRNVTGAAALLRGDVRLKDADVIALQEMDEVGVECLARTLGLNYVYYPAAVHPADHRNFGNAILSPWPIEDDVEIPLPHPGRFRKMQRIAVAATVRIRGDLPVRVFSVHLETPAGASAAARRDQGRTIVERAEGYPRVLVAGDFNGRGFIEKAFTPVGFRGLTPDGGRPTPLFPWGHL